MTERNTVVLFLSRFDNGGPEAAWCTVVACSKNLSLLAALFLRFGTMFCVKTFGALGKIYWGAAGFKLR